MSRFILIFPQPTTLVQAEASTTSVYSIGCEDKRLREPTCTQQLWLIMDNPLYGLRSTTAQCAICTVIYPCSKKFPVATTG